MGILTLMVCITIAFVLGMIIGGATMDVKYEQAMDLVTDYKGTAERCVIGFEECVKVLERAT